MSATSQICQASLALTQACRSAHGKCWYAGASGCISGLQSQVHLLKRCKKLGRRRRRQITLAWHSSCRWQAAQQHLRRVRLLTKKQQSSLAPRVDAALRAGRPGGGAAAVLHPGLWQSRGGCQPCAEGAALPRPAAALSCHHPAQVQARCVLCRALCTSAKADASSCGSLFCTAFTLRDASSSEQAVSVHREMLRAQQHQERACCCTCREVGDKASYTGAHTLVGRSKQPAVRAAGLCLLAWHS